MYTTKAENARAAPRNPVRGKTSGERRHPVFEAQWKPADDELTGSGDRLPRYTIWTARTPGDIPRRFA